MFVVKISKETARIMRTTKKRTFILCRRTLLVALMIFCAAVPLMEGTPDDRTLPETSTPVQQLVACNTRNCMTRESRRVHDIESIKKKILQKLRMSGPPNMTLPFTLPRVPYIETTIMEYSNQQHFEDDESDDYEPATIQNIFYIAERDVASQGVIFRLGNATNAETVTSAKLNVYAFRDRRLEHRDETVSVVLHRILAPGLRNKEVLRRRRISTRHLDNWIQFNLTLVAIDWINQPLTNFGLFVEIVDNRGRQLSVLSVNCTENELMKPYLDVQFKDPAAAATTTSPSRSRRTTSNDCDDSSVQSLCCRYPLELDFAVFGWSWVIAPRRVNAYYCAGMCPYAYIPMGPLAHISHQIVNTTGGGPCCAPMKYSDVKILYMAENGTITHSVVPGLIVEKCGCW